MNEVNQYYLCVQRMESTAAKKCRDVEDLDLVEQGSLVSFNECFLVCRVTGAICCILI